MGKAEFRGPHRHRPEFIPFIEDSWLAGQRIGQGSFDAIASPVAQMFNFTKIRTNEVLFLNPSPGERVP
jgi:phospholipase C